MAFSVFLVLSYKLLGAYRGSLVTQPRAFSTSNGWLSSFMKSVNSILRVAANVSSCAALWICGGFAHAEEPKWVDQTVEESIVDLPEAKVADVRSPRFEGGLMFGGYLLGRDLELGVPDKPGFVSGPRTLNAITGLRFSVEALPRLQIEIESGIASTKDREDHISATIITGRLQGVAEVDINNFFAKQHFRPFVLAGLGFASIVSTDGSVDALGNHYGLPNKDTDGEFHAGVGVKWDPHELVTFRSDLRIYQMPNTKSQGLTSTWELTIGASFKFGRRWGRELAE